MRKKKEDVVKKRNIILWNWTKNYFSIKLFCICEGSLIRSVPSLGIGKLLLTSLSFVTEYLGAFIISLNRGVIRTGAGKKGERQPDSWFGINYYSLSKRKNGLRFFKCLILTSFLYKGSSPSTWRYLSIKVKGASSFTNSRVFFAFTEHLKMTIEDSRLEWKTSYSASDSLAVSEIEAVQKLTLPNFILFLFLPVSSWV